MSLGDKAHRIRFIVMDCDGVLTDGRLYFSAAVEELKVFNVRDGQGLVNWHRAGNRSGIISGRNSPIVDVRGKQLGIEFIYQGRDDKIAAINELILEAGALREEVAFIGDDAPDAEVFPFVGLSIAVADAHVSAKAAADHITNADGGRGAVREVIDMLLERKGS